MKCGLFLVGLFLSICSCTTDATNRTSSSKKIEDVSPDYGILSLAERTRKGHRPLMWRCFPIGDVEVRYRRWPYTDSEEPGKAVEIMCDFEIWVSSKPFQNVYHGRRGKPEGYCKDFKAAWNRLTQGEAHICIDGETLTKGQPQEGAGSKGMKASWTWDKIMTKKGCYSFWDGDQCVDF